MQKSPISFIKSKYSIKNDLEVRGFNDVEIWSYSYMAPFYSAEEVFEWESMRTSYFRIQNNLNTELSNRLKNEFLSKSKPKLNKYGMLELTTGAIFTKATKTSVEY